MTSDNYHLDDIFKIQEELFIRLIEKPNVSGQIYNHITNKLGYQQKDVDSLKNSIEHYLVKSGLSKIYLVYLCMILEKIRCDNVPTYKSKILTMLIVILLLQKMYDDYIPSMAQFGAYIKKYYKEDISTQEITMYERKILQECNYSLFITIESLHNWIINFIDSRSCMTNIP